MLTNFEVLLYASSLIVLPIAIYSLLTGSKAPEGTWIAKYYAAETYLGPAGNVFLLAVCANGTRQARIAFRVHRSGTDGQHQPAHRRAVHGTARRLPRPLDQSGAESPRSANGETRP